MNWKEYFKKNSAGGANDYRLTIGEDGIGKMHPLNRRGDTLDVKIAGDGIVIIKEEPKRKEVRHGGNEATKNPE